MLLILRNIEMQPLAGDKVEECYKNQVQIIQTLKMCMSLDKDVTYAAIMVVKDINKNPKPLDLIILLLVFSGTTKQKTAEALLKQNIRCGFYRISLLHTLYNDYKEVCTHLANKKYMKFLFDKYIWRLLCSYIIFILGHSGITTINIAISE